MEINKINCDIRLKIVLEQLEKLEINDTSSLYFEIKKIRRKIEDIREDLT